MSSASGAEACHSGPGWPSRSALRIHDVTALIGIACPVNRYDFSAVVAAGRPTFLIHGERDELIPLQEIRRFYALLSEPKELVVIDGADHLFDGKVSEVGEAIEDLLQDFNG